MRREHETAKAGLVQSQSEVLKLQERCRKLEATLSETQALLRAREAEIEKLVRATRTRTDSVTSRTSSASSPPFTHLQVPRRHPPTRGSSFNGSETRNSQYMPTTSQCDTEEESADSLSLGSEEDRAVTRSAESFLTKIDHWSGAQIIQTVQDLNSEILQFAASATELCVYDRRVSINALVRKNVIARLGPALTHLLATRDHSEEPMLVQIAVQGCASLIVAQALSTFCLGYQKKANALLTQLYQHMYTCEPQPTSSRWRALSHRCIRDLNPDLVAFATQEIATHILSWTLDVFLVSKCASGANSTLDDLRLRFDSQVRRIATVVAKLAQVTREEIMSVNFEIVAVELGQRFDRKEMVDAFEEYGTSYGETLCTTELGLKCSSRKGENEERRLLLRPKVVLDSVVDMLDNA